MLKIETHFFIIYYKVHSYYFHFAKSFFTASKQQQQKITFNFVKYWFIIMHFEEIVERAKFKYCVSIIFNIPL